MRETHKPPKTIPIVWHSDVMDSFKTPNIVTSIPTQNHSSAILTQHIEMDRPISFRDTTLAFGKSLKIHLSESYSIV
jgi:competence transcription factor ComK